MKEAGGEKGRSPFEISPELRKAEKMFRSQAAQQERERLSEGEKEEIEKVSIALAKETLVLRMCIGKPLDGERVSVDFHAKTLYSRLAKYSAQEWFSRWRGTVPEEVARFLGGRESNTAVILNTASPDWRVLYYHGMAPPHCNKIDSRIILVEYALILPTKGEALRRIESAENAEALRLLPFGILHTGMRLAKDENEAKYVDGSITGINGAWKDPWQKKPNSMMLLDIPQGITMTVKDITEKDFSRKQENSADLIKRLGNSRIAKRGVTKRDTAFLIPGYWRY